MPNRGWIGRSRRGLAVLLVYVSALSIFVAVIATIDPAGQRNDRLVESMPEYAETIREESSYWNSWYEKPSPSIFASRLRPIWMRSGCVAGARSRH